MADKKVGAIDVGKALMNVSFVVLAAAGGASGIVPLAALATVPLAASQSVGPLLERFRSKQDDSLEFPVPIWWNESIASWQGLCKEIETRLPDILNAMAHRLQQERGVVTTDVVQQAFIDAFSNEPLVWESDPQKRRRIAEYIAPSLLQKISEMLKAIIEPIRQETALVDIHGTSGNTANMLVVLERIYEELRKQGEQRTSLNSQPPLAAQPPHESHTASVAPTTPPSSTSIPTTNTKKDSQEGDFDVFICYNSADLIAVREIVVKLKDRGLRPWFDKWELIPGRLFQSALEEQIKGMKTAAVFIGDRGLGPWHRMEMQAALLEFAERDCPVIPVLLPGAKQKPDLPRFLKIIGWVDLNEPDALDQLMRGITASPGKGK